MGSDGAAGASAPPTDGADLRHVSRARGHLFRCNKPGQAPAAVGSRGGATWTPRECGTGRWGGAAWGLTGSSRWRPSPGWRERKRGGVGGFKKGVGFEGFWPTHTTAPRTSTTRRKNQGGGRRGEQGGRRGGKGNKNKRGEAKQGERAPQTQRQGRGGIIPQGSRDLGGSGRGGAPARRRSEGDRRRASVDAGEVSTAC